MRKVLFFISVLLLVVLTGCFSGVKDNDEIEYNEKLLDDEIEFVGYGFGKEALSEEELEILKEINTEYPEEITITSEDIVKRAWTNPSKSEIISELKKAGIKYNIPYEVLYGIAYAESGLRQFKNGKPYISPDDGIGIMQVTPHAVSEVFNRNSLEYDYKYNIDAGAKVILGKWKWVSKANPIGNSNSEILENWYLTIWAYNGYSYINNPKEYAKNLLDSQGRRKFSNAYMSWYRYRPYQEDVIRFIKSELGVTLTSLTTVTANNNKIPAAGTRKVPIIASGVKFTTPTNYHYTENKDTAVIPGTIDYTIPSKININSTVTFSGTCTGVVSAKRQIKGSSIIDLGKVSGGKFTFDVTFLETVGEREMTVWGYNSAGKEVAKVVKKFNVTDPNVKNYTLTVSHNANVISGEEVTFSGTANDISKVLIKVDSKAITTDKISVTSGKYSFKYKSTTTGANKKVEVIGYDLAEKEVKTTTSTITITAPVVSKIDYTVPSNIKLGTATTFKGTFSGNVATVKRQVTGSTLVNLGKVSGGSFSFDVTFLDKVGEREMTVWGYDSSGKEVAKVIKKFNVGAIVSTINYTTPTTVRVNTTAKFSGTFTGEVATVKRQITGSTVVNLGKVSGGKFSFEVTFGSDTGTREMTVWGYDSSGKEVAKVVKKFDVTKKGTVTAATLNIRSGAGTNFGILGTLTSGKTVEIVSTSSGWHKIKYNGGYGYVSTSYIK